MKGAELFRVPCDLSSSAFRAELIATYPAVVPVCSSVMGRVVQHAFTDRDTGQSVLISEQVNSIFAEVDGDLAVWLRVREVALRAACHGTAPAVRADRPRPGYCRSPNDRPEPVVRKSPRT